MTRTRTFLMLAAVMLAGVLGLAGGAGAQTLIHSTDWTTGTFGSPTAGAAGTTTGAGDGWIDNAGGVLSSSGGVLNVAGGSSPWSSGQQGLRPTSENVRDEQMVSTLSANQSGVYRVFRVSGNNMYIIGQQTTTQVGFFTIVGGSLTELNGGGINFTSSPAAATDRLQFTESVSGALPSTLSAKVVDLTSGATLLNYTCTDSNSALQAAAQMGVLTYNNTAQYQKIATYNLSAAAPAATAFTLSPASGSGVAGAASNPFTVAPNAALSAAESVALSDGSAGGTFSPSSLSFASGAAAGQTFTYTPAAGKSVGTAITLTATPSPALGTAPTATYTIAAPAAIIGVTSPAVHFSPGNWAGDTGRAGSVYRQTWCNGAYVSFYFTASASPTATLNISNQTTGSDITYFLNGVEHDNVAVPASGGIVLSGITASAVNVLSIYARNSNQSSRWNEANAYKITGLSLDGASSAGTAPAGSGKWVLEVGDSITEGIYADPSSSSDALYDYSYLLGQSLLQQGYDYGVSACGYSGWLRPGDSGGDVPAYYPVSSGTYQGGGRWNQIDSVTSLLDSNNHISAYGSTGQEPAAITLNYGTNEALQSSSTSDTQASVTQCLAALRGAAPNALILVYAPFNLYATGIYSNGPSYVASVKAGVAAYQSAHPSDTKVTLADFGTTLAAQLYALTAAIHPNALGHAQAAADAAGVLFPKLLSTVAAPNLYLGSGQIKRGR